MSSTSPTIETLQRAVRGTVTRPDDADYDDARALFYGGLDLHPAAIVRAADADDVAAVVRLAAAEGLELAVRSGGHSAAGHGSTEGGILLDMAGLKGIDLDVEGRTVWAGAGLTAGELTTAVGAHGLVIGFGDTGSVGIGGITLGGGVGYLVRAFGLTIDNLLGVDLVTADGELRRVDAEHDPDLFWAVRGGGGNFGVVTQFRYRLHHVPEVTGGMLVLPGTAEVIAGFIAAAEAAPDELSGIANVMPCPPFPFVPPEQHGRLVVMSLVAYAGDAKAGARALAPFRALATPLADMVRPIAYAEMFPPDEGGYHPIAAARTMFVDRIDRDAAQLIVDRLEEHVRTTSAQMAVAQLRVLGGAMARVPADATAFAHRSSRIMVNLAALVGSTAELAEHEPWVAALAAALDQGDGGAYVNFVADEGPERIHAAYPAATLARLTAIKRRHDPANLFHRNQNIAPDGAAASS